MFNQLAGLAVHNLMRARARLAMTAGGVLVGTAAVTILIALTIGLQRSAESGIGSSTALTSINVYVGYNPSQDVDAEIPRLSPAVVRQFWDIPDVVAVIPTTYFYGGELLVGDLRGGAQLLGIDPRLLPYLGVAAAEGDLAIAPGEVVVGAAVGDNFFDPESEEGFTPVRVDLMTQPPTLRYFSMQGEEDELDLAVNGVLAPGSNYDYTIFLPIEQVIELNTAINGQEFDPETFVYDQVEVRASSRETVMQVSDAIKAMGFGAGGMGEYLNQINGFFTTMRVVLGGVGGVALLVAAFGVANTMTMAILERTREIGLMKAVGARDRDILTVFLCEAALVGLVGGVAGMGVSLLLQGVINEALRNAPQGEGGSYFLPIDPTQLGDGLVIIPPELALFTLGLATLVGIAAGLLPALRAARMTTVVALKTE
jgi:putative ABC transport system permease protein